MNDAKPMQIFQPMRNVYQLLKPFIPVIAREDTVTHKLCAVYFPVLLDELVDITMIHPF